MYLNQFKEENVQKAIYNVCIYCAMANNKIVEEEKKLLKDFCNELGIAYYEEPTCDFDSSISVIADKCSASDKKKILMELLSVMLADGECDEREWEFLKENVISKFGVTVNDLEAFYKALQQLYMIYGHINSLVM